MANPNIVNVTSIYGKSLGQYLSTSGTSILTNSANSNKIFKINTIIVANSNGTSAVDVTLRVFTVVTDQNPYLAYTISVPADSTLVVISKDTSFYLGEGDYIHGYCSSANDATIFISYEEIS